MPARAHLVHSREVNSTLHLQRTIGNQAVQPISQTNPEKPEAGLARMATPLFERDFSLIPIHPSQTAIPTKLAINKPGDIYEQEADRITEQVMRKPEPQLQHNCACGGGCPRCQTEQPGRERESLQTKRVQAVDTGQIAAPPIVHEVLRSPGQPLDPATRAFMEPRFGHDFSRVRVHTDAKAAESARAVNALAYTVGHDVAFGAGQYAPKTSEGRRLLAHELTHVVQKGPGEGMVHRQPALSPTEVPMEAQIRHELERELPPDAEAAILGRKRALIEIFSRFNERDAMVLHGRLSARAPGDSLASLFHHRLARPTVDQMLGILLRRSRRGDEPVLGFTDPTERFLEGLEVIRTSPQILLDPTQHPEEKVALQLWSSAPFPPVMDFSAQLTVEREEIGAHGEKGVVPVVNQILPWKAPIKLGFIVGVTAQKPGHHRVTLKVLDSKQQVVRIIRQNFEVETTIPQGLAALKNHPQYADSVVTAYYDPNRGPRQRGLSTWIPVQYADSTIIDLNFSDFSPTGSATPFRWDNGKIFPENITPVSAPNLTAIKHAVDKWIDDYNVMFIIQAWTAVVYPTITGVPMRVGPAPMATIPTTAGRRPAAAAPVRPGTPSSGGQEPLMPAPSAPVRPPAPPTGAAGGGGPGAPTPAAPIGGAMRTNVGQGQIIVDTDALIALDRAAQPGVTPPLSPGEQQIVKATQGRSIIATPTTAGQFNAAGERGTVPVTQPIAHTPAQRQAILQELEATAVGGAGAKGAADREIVADALLAQTEPGVVTVFQPADKGVINGLARLSNMDPARLPKGYNVAEYLRYERGVGVFTINVGGRILVVRPIQPIGPRR